MLLQVRKGMVLVDERAKPAACWEFDADIAILTHSTTIQPRYQVSGEKLVSLVPGQADVIMGKLFGLPALARTAMRVSDAPPAWQGPLYDTTCLLQRRGGLSCLAAILFHTAACWCCRYSLT